MEWPTKAPTLRRFGAPVERVQVLGEGLEAPVDAVVERLRRHALDVLERADDVSRCSGRVGAMPKPQLPITTLVTPCQLDGVRSPSQRIWAS